MIKLKDLIKEQFTHFKPFEPDWDEEPYEFVPESKTDEAISGGPGPAVANMGVTVPELCQELGKHSELLRWRNDNNEYMEIPLKVLQNLGYTQTELNMIDDATPNGGAYIDFNPDQTSVNIYNS